MTKHPVTFPQRMEGSSRLIVSEALVHGQLLCAGVEHGGQEVERRCQGQKRQNAVPKDILFNYILLPKALVPPNANTKVSPANLSTDEARPSQYGCHSDEASPWETGGHFRSIP